MADLDDLIGVYYQALRKDPDLDTTYVLKELSKLDHLEDIDVPKISVYGRSSCPYCREARELVEPIDRCVYIELDDIGEYTSPHHIEPIKNAPSIPIVFSKHEYVGGLDELKKLLAN